MYKQLSLLFTLMLFIPLFIFSQETEELLLIEGDESFEKFDHKAALASYEKVINVNSNNYEANWKLSRAFVDIGEDREDEE